MSPTVFRAHGLRFFFFSREERRVHIHVEGASGEAKFWIEPRVDLAENHGLTPKELSRARELITEHERLIRDSWKEHFSS